MKSPEHAVLGALTAGALSVALPLGTVEAVGLFVYGVGLSVFVDLDHFLIARYHAGDWSHLRRCVGDPAFAFTQQERVFDGVDTTTLETHRLLSHALVGGALVGAIALYDPVYARFTAVVLYVHVVADLLRDGDLA
ncbi:hypothetical protein [Halorussus marinus]|uniref:hypothetical protein n=1 Tax=Halorussus marinus TaxID=2505976 RepID=UPI00106E84F5|nr:hypothetical protein [Halorussus marinus]